MRRSTKGDANATERASEPRAPTPADPLAGHVETIASFHAEAQEGLGAHQRLIERLTARIGRPRTLYVLLALVATWVLVNTTAHLLGRAALDPPPFFWMQGALGLYAALVTTIVLTTQNRQQKHAERRAYLELQVNLMAEQKTAKIINLLEELRRDLPSVRNRVDREAEVMGRAVDARAVVTALEETLENGDAEASDAPGDKAPP